MDKKRVIAYLHTHWDREWYREFEVFRLRLLRVFDNVLNLLTENKIPSFYFDGQVCALEDYLELRPEKEELVRKFIQEKRLFIGPCYTLVDEFLTTRECFEKNLEIGLSIAKKYGCTDFVGYLADTFGHSKYVAEVFQKFGIDKCVVWRGCGDFPSEFRFNGVNTVNLVRGYFMDIFSAPMSIEKKAEWLKTNLDKIAEKSGDVLLLPIGADHLGIEGNIAEQISQVNDLIESYHIELSSLFRYFEQVKDRFEFSWEDELRDNSKTFILTGSYSARTNIKQYNTKACYLLNLADKFQKHFGNNYSSAVEYAYKLLLKNQAHDGICGCSTDVVHRENIIRYEKVIEIAQTILKELKFAKSKDFDDFWMKYNADFRSVMEFESIQTPSECQIISSRQGFSDTILYDTQRIPITEDYTNINLCLKEIVSSDDELQIENGKISNSKISLKLKGGKILVNDKYEVDFVRYDDIGDTYNFGAVEGDKGESAKILGSEVILAGGLRVGLKIQTDFFDVKVYLDKNSQLLKFNIEWENTLKNKLWQVRFKLPNPVCKTVSEDMGKLLVRKFEPDYDIRKNLPKTKGVEARTNTAPIQRFVGAQGIGLITKGLNEYDVYKNFLSLTLLRSIGVISNPANPTRTTPAGPPLAVNEAQQLGKVSAEFAFGEIVPENYSRFVHEFFLNGIVI